MAAFEWKIDGLFKTDPNVAGQICEQLSTSDGGLTPARLVEISRDVNAPLHNEFEWDDSFAANSFREIQAAGIIRNLVCTVVKSNGETVKDRQFVSAPGGKKEYVPLHVGLDRDDYNRQLLKRAYNDMLIFVARYRRLSELSQVVGIMQTMISEPPA